MFTYSAFVDMSGGRHDDAALVYRTPQDRVVVIDQLKKYKAPHNPYEVVALMVKSYAAIMSVMCVAMPTQRNGQGLLLNRMASSMKEPAERYSRKVGRATCEGGQATNCFYLELLPRLTACEIELPDNEQLVTQLCLLQRRTRSGGRDASTIHPVAMTICKRSSWLCDVVFRAKEVNPRQPSRYTT